MLEDRPPKLDPDAIALSVILPIHDEEKNLQPLITEIAKALDGKVGTYEIICVDDGSRDASWKMLKQLKATHPQLVLLKFRRNFGQTAAMQAGLDHARGSTIALMDADMQNDPADIPSMVAELRAKDLDLLAGWRKQRQDFWLSRRLPSRIANWLIGKTTGVRLHDYGCTLKVLDRGLAKELRLYGEMHRFIPALAKWIGANIDERVVNHRERLHGQSKYGIGRVSRVLLDLALVLFQRTYAAKPMQIFGKWGRHLHRPWVGDTLVAYNRQALSWASPGGSTSPYPGSALRDLGNSAFRHWHHRRFAVTHLL